MLLIADFAAEETVFDGYHVFFKKKLEAHSGAYMETLLSNRLDNVYKHMLADLPASQFALKKKPLVEERRKMEALVRTCSKVHLWNTEKQLEATFLRREACTLTHRLVIDFGLPRSLKDFLSWWPLQCFFVELEKQTGWTADMGDSTCQMFGAQKVVVTCDASIFNPRVGLDLGARKKRRRALE